jgi:RNA polymerase sigma-70 factor (ECF subfamily)
MSATPGKGKTEVRRQNEARLASLYEEYYDRIARYARVHIGDQTEAEDLAGEVFLKALDSLDSYQERGVPMQAWLFRIAHNLVVDHLSRKARLKTVPIETIPLESNGDPMKLAERNIELERVNQAMAQLTRDQREVLRLRLLGGLTSREVGDILQKKESAVREMQRAALEKLRKLLTAEG